MPIDLGTSPTGTPPTAEEKTQILSALGIGDAATRSGAETLTNKTITSPIFAGAANGQLDIPTQAATTASSVITRSLYEQEFHQNFWCPINWVTPTATANASGSVSGQNAVLGLTGGSAVAGNSSHTSDFDNMLNNAGSGANNRFGDARFTICFDLQSNGVSNNEYRLLYGITSTATSLAAAGFGIVWTASTALKLQIHNGTTLQESASLTVPSISINNFNRYMIVWNGPTLTLYNKPVNIAGTTFRWSLIGSITGSSLPVSASGTKIVAANVATGTPTFSPTMRIRSFNIAPFIATI
jgi:hypothetical protein